MWLSEIETELEEYYPITYDTFRAKGRRMARVIRELATRVKLYESSTYLTYISGLFSDVEPLSPDAKELVE